MRIIAKAALAAIALAGSTTLALAQANTSCLDPRQIEDADVARYAEALADPTLCLTRGTVEENGIVWDLLSIANTVMPGPLWAVPHDEEDEAFAGAVYAVRRYGGSAIVIENDEERLVDGLDPNHVFAADAEAATTCELAAAWPSYVAAFLQAHDPAYPVIGLHSNWDGYLEAGGLGSISVNRDDEKMRPFPSAVAEGRFADEDTIAMLVGRSLPEESAASAAIGWITGAGVHVIYRHVTPENNGCTLADYLTLNGLGFYINLEVEHGDAETMPALIDRAMEFIDSAAFAGML